MPKEKSINPAQAQRKAEKAKAVKKGTLPSPQLLVSGPTPHLLPTKHKNNTPPQAKQKPNPGAPKSSPAVTPIASKRNSPPSSPLRNQVGN